MRQQAIVRKTLLKFKNRIFGQTPKAYIPNPAYEAERSDLKQILLIVTSRTFSQNANNAETLLRKGLARGWSKVCGPAKLVSIDQIINEIELFDTPAVFMTSYDFNQLTYVNAKKLRKVKLFVWVSPHPRTNKMYEQKVINPYEDNNSEMWLNSYGKVVMAEPKFVWNAIGAAGMEWFRGWIDDGFRWETIYPAADLSRYFPDPVPNRFSQIKMAYVGGYWPEKAQGFNLYLRPWEDILYPFGYDVWPYKNYSGRLDDQGERQLYSSAGLIPLVTGPFGWMMAEITERYFKAPACLGFCIADQNLALREIYGPNEMLQAESPEQFHQLVNDYLAGKIDRDEWASKSYKAVLDRHTYSHRAKQIMNALSQKEEYTI